MATVGVKGLIRIFKYYRRNFEQAAPDGGGVKMEKGRLTN